MGDGVLVEFGSAVNAVNGAIELQKKMTAANEGVEDNLHVVLRIGINLGDVIGEGSDIYGEGVNIAARLEPLARPGGVAISAQVYDAVRGKTIAAFEDIGEQALKNIERPIRIYAVHLDGWDVREHAPPALPKKPSIAVLPFTNMSDESDQGYFADGLTEDLITDLSRNAGLFVIARNSTFAYKGKSVDVRTVARDLGVRYVLEGSARRAANRVRINVQLIDAIGGGHLWADRYDRSLADIFTVQDEVTAKIVEALVGRLISPPTRNKPKNMDAYDLCVRARALISDAAGSPEAVREAALLLEQATALDPGYAEAYRWRAFNLWAAWAQSIEPIDPTRRLSVKFAEEAVALDPNDAGNHWVLGHVMAYEHRWVESDAALAKALELDPNHADAWAIRSEFTAMGGEPVTAIEEVSKALRLNPHPAGWYYWELGLAQYAAGQYEGAIETLRKEGTYRTASRRTLAASLAQLGRLDEARREAALFMATNPAFRIRQWALMQPSRDESMLEHFVDGYRKAGLPE